MGKKQKHWNKQKNPPHPRNPEWSDEPIEKKNPIFEKFYKAQKIVPEAEWDSFMAAFRERLPHSFRLVGCKSESETLLGVLNERYLSKLTDSKVDGEDFQPPKVLSWYPGGLGFQMNIPRHVLRKQIVLNSLHNFLVTETELGHISRQETVSMVPPLLLDVQAEHSVLDLCAAPGSKTAQLIEALHATQHSPYPKGCVVANDSDNKRCYLLVHQSLKRLQNACCLVTNHDAAQFPNIHLGEGKLLEFDRILCDVPCTGDGTLRKNMDIWKSWNLNSSYNLHRVQYRIAKRGLELLKVGGRMVYSTCSLNPAEDEAVIHRLLQFAQGSVELVDVSNELPGLKRTEGLYTWKIMDRDGNEIPEPESIPEEKKSQIYPSVFPPGEEELRQMNMERCFRILPHHQDTGGFFVAVLHKTDLFPWQKEKKERAEESPSRKKPRRNFGFKEDPFTFFQENDPRWLEISGFFGLSPSFPYENLFSRSGESVLKRTLYLANDTLKQILINNADKLKVINAGMKVFGRVEQKFTECKYRLLQDGLQVIFPFLTRRLVRIDKEDLSLVLRTERKQRGLEDLSGPAREAISGVGHGSAVLWTQAKGHRVSICVWLGAVSVTPYVGKDARLHLLRLLGEDTTEFEKEMLSNRKKDGAKSAKVEEGELGGVEDGGMGQEETDQNVTQEQTSEFFA